MCTELSAIGEAYNVNCLKYEIDDYLYTCLECKSTHYL